MQLQYALTMYKLPYAIVNTINAGGYTSFELSAIAGGATVSKLQTRLTDLKKSTGLNLEIIDTGTKLYLRSRTNQPVYKYMDYNGHINYDDINDPFIVGFDSNGRIVMDDIDHARHMLVAGTTGSGKSVFLHNLIFTFAYNHINKLYLIDCKRVELNIYDKCAVVASDVFGGTSAASITADLLNIIEDRFKEMQKLGVNDFLSYHALRPDEKRHILVVDELADLISTKEARKTLIPRLLRIAQIGRAAGVHLIIATQRPDHTVIDGTLKGNIPTRIAFNCISGTDSRVILDKTGAENLTGNGDGLYLRNGAQQLERIQAPYITLDEIRQYIAPKAITGTYKAS